MTHAKQDQTSAIQILLLILLVTVVTETVRWVRTEKERATYQEFERQIARIYENYDRITGHCEWAEGVDQWADAVSEKLNLVAPNRHKHQLLQPTGEKKKTTEPLGETSASRRSLLSSYSHGS